MPRFILTLCCATLLATAAHAQSTLDKAQRDEVAFMSSEEPAMRRAFDKARASLDTFLRAAANPAPGTENYALKVAVSEGDATEYFWIGDFKRAGDGFTGELANEPRLVKKFRNGQRISFSRKLIVDWMYIDARRGRMLGNFTGCALLSKEPPAEARKFREAYGLQCD